MHKVRVVQTYKSFNLLLDGIYISSPWSLHPICFSMPNHSGSFPKTTWTYMTFTLQILLTYKQSKRPFTQHVSIRWRQPFIVLLWAALDSAWKSIFFSNCVARHGALTCFPSQHSPLQVWFSFKSLKRALRFFWSLSAAIVRAYLSITLSISWQSSGFKAWLSSPACLRRILHNIERYHCKSYRIPLAVSFKSPRCLSADSIHSLQKHYLNNVS